PDGLKTRLGAIERIAAWDRVVVERPVPGSVDVDPQDLAEEPPLVLRVVPWVPSPTSVTDADVQEAVRAERHRAAVVVALGTVLDKQQRAGGALDDIGACGVGREPGDDDVATVARVVNEQSM